MYRVVPITEPRLTTSKEMRSKCPFAVVGPWHAMPQMETFWPFETEAQAIKAAAQMNAGTWVEPAEEDWAPGELTKAMREISKKG
jgi:hypothetical protein